MADDFQNTVDGCFSQIQRYIIEYDGLTKMQKENMIYLCIEANDMLLKIRDNPKEYPFTR